MFVCYKTYSGFTRARKCYHSKISFTITIGKKATSNIKIDQIFRSIGLHKVGIYLRDGLISSDIGIVKVHDSIETQWVVYINQKYFDSYGCSPPQKLSKYIKKRNGHCFCSEYEKPELTSERDCYCASFFNRYFS